MIDRLLQGIQQFLRMGIPKGATFVEEQKTYMYNLFLLVAAPFAFLSLVVNIYFASLLPGILNVLQLLIFGWAFRISYLQKGQQQRSLLLLLLAVIAAIAAYFFRNGSEYRLLVMMIAAVVVFDKNWQYICFSLLVSAVFVSIRLDDILLVQDSVLQQLAEVLKILVPLIVFTMSLFFFKHIYFTNLQQLQNTNKELSVAQEQKSRILNTVAHDLRSPVNNISGICHVMLADKEFTPAQKELVQLVLHASDTSLTLINELLQKNSVAVNHPAVKKHDLNLVISQAVALLQVNAGKKNCSLSDSYHTGELMVKADKHRMIRVLTNLVNNAIKFSSAGSVISIRTESEGGNAVFSVSDQGIGIPKEDQENIFEMLTHTRRRGTEGETSYGMGLSICREIIKEHGGQITLESEVGKGSCFSVKLPLYSEND
jgi:signal transduction histidine kinase